MKDTYDGPSTELLLLPEKAELSKFFDDETKLNDLIDRIETETLAIHQDYETAKGRKAAKSLAAKVSSSKTLLEEVRKEKTEGWRMKTAAVNALGKVAVERLDTLRDKIKGPAEAKEKEEADRQAKHMRALDQFDQEQLSAHSSSAELKSLIGKIDAIEVNDAWEEFEAEARESKAAALAKYQSDLVVAEEREEQARELEELRKEKAEREAREAEAQKKAQAEAEAKEAEERKKREEEEAKKKAREDAEREAKEREERLRQELEAAKARELEAAAAERKRIEDEKRAEADAEAKRKADAAHRLKIRTEIVEGFLALAPDGWETAVDAMIDGKIPHVKVAV
ncbi:MAG: hypothetical protein EpisKO_41310 [Epibacterium sp.]